MNRDGASNPPEHHAWSRIEAWLGTHAPEALEVLRPGASEDAIRAAEAALELELPEPYRRSVAHHDGQEWRWPSLVEFGVLMSLQQVIEQSRTLAEHPWAEECPEDPWWRPGLVPVVSRDGDSICLDLDPPQGRPSGEVCVLLHGDEPAFRRIAPDFATWLERWASELEAGVFALDRAAGAGLLPRDGEGTSQLWPR